MIGRSGVNMPLSRLDKPGFGRKNGAAPWSIVLFDRNEKGAVFFPLLHTGNVVKFPYL